MKATYSSWNMAGLRSRNYRVPQPRKMVDHVVCGGALERPLTQQEAARVLGSGGQDNAVCRACGYHLCSCGRPGSRKRALNAGDREQEIRYVIPETRRFGKTETVQTVREMMLQQGLMHFPSCAYCGERHDHRIACQHDHVQKFHHDRHVAMLIQTQQQLAAQIESARAERTALEQIRQRADRTALERSQQRMLPSQPTLGAAVAQHFKARYGSLATPTPAEVKGLQASLDRTEHQKRQIRTDAARLNEVSTRLKAFGAIDPSKLSMADTSALIPGMDYE